jgi:hypothetical protein
LVEEAKICFMNKGSTLQGMVRSFPLQVMPGDIPQFAIQERDESIERLLVTRLPLHQELSYELRWWFGHGRTAGGK